MMPGRVARRSPGRARHAPVAIGVALLCVGCATYATTARDEFVHAVACPEDRVSVVERRADAPPVRTPPPEVAADPERLAVWKRDEDARQAAAADKTLYVATGCGQTRTYDCRDLRRGAIYCEEKGEP